MVAALSVVLAALASYGIYGFAISSLVFGVAIFSFGAFSRKLTQMLIGAVATGVSGLVLGLAYLSWSLFGTGTIYTRSAWPHELEKMVEFVDADTDSVLAVALGGYIDSESAWRLTINENQFEHLSEGFGFEPIPPSANSHCKNKLTPWWPTENDEKHQHYKTAGFLLGQRGLDGIHYYAVWNSDSNHLHVWGKFNF